MYKVFGSTAIKYYYPDYPREPKDLDIISDDYKVDGVKGIEVHWTRAFNYLAYEPVYITPDKLFTIKLSHIPYHTRNFDKHVKDVIFLRDKGAKLDLFFYDTLVRDWNERFGKTPVNLNCSNEEFFKENIKRNFNHDWLHEQVMFYKRPLHECIRKDLNSPACSEELFNQLQHYVQVKLALEEIFVIALERFLLTRVETNVKIAKYNAMKKLITSSTTGWFNRFLIINFDILYKSHTDILESHYKKLNALL